MLNRTQLADLYKSLRQAMVLSVYVDGSQSDPAERRAWRTVLDRGLADERRRLERESPDEVPAFDAARALIEGELERFKAFMPPPGWAGFATADEVHYAEGDAVALPDLVRWERGIRVAPYVRALKQERAVAAAIADSRKSRLFTYRDGQLEENFDMVADRDFGDLADSVSSTRGGRFSGARGETGTDLARRLNDRSATQLQAELLDALEELAGPEGFVVFGGRTEVTAAMANEAGRFGDRWIEVPGMHLDMTEAEVRLVLASAASALTRKAQDALLDRVVDQARSGGKGSLGIQATKEALREGRVDALLVTPGLREREPDIADHFVGSAFEQGAGVEELSGDGAERLDREGEGVAARLRYTA
jgi:hypothetical protein